MNNSEEFWRKTIDELSSSLPPEGEGPPAIESINPPRKKRKVQDGKRKVLVQKIFTTVYVFTDPDGKVYTSHCKQDLHILGMMTLEQGLRKAQEDSENSA